MGNDPVSNPPPQQPPPRADLGEAVANAERGLNHGLDVARPYLDAANSLLGTAVSPRPSDAYDPRRSPTEHLSDMNRFVAFRPTGRAFEVAAMGDRNPADPHAAGGRRGPEEGVRVIRDGRMIVMPGRGSEEASESRESHAAHATPEARAAAAAGAALQRALGGAISKEDLSQFERIFMAHFEGGIPIGDKLTPGQFKFLAKSEKAWVEFFQKFLPFMLVKTGKVSDVEMLVFRGLLKDLPAQFQGKGGPGGKAALPSKEQALFLVSDMKFLNGKTDKFARLQIQSEALAKTMSEKMPGDVLGKDVLAMMADKANGEEFSYLSLSHKVVNPDMVDPAKNPIAEAYRTPEQVKQQAIREGTRDMTQGIALNARTEQLIAEKLDINLKTQTRGDVIGADRRGAEGQGAPGVDLGGLFLNKKKRKGLGEGAGDADDSPVFVPWLRRDPKPQQFKGKPRWWVPFLYFLAASGAALTLVYVVRNWMAR